jgi:hypothetical protein
MRTSHNIASVDEAFVSRNECQDINRAGNVEIVPQTSPVATEVNGIPAADWANKRSTANQHDIQDNSRLNLG